MKGCEDVGCNALLLTLGIEATKLRQGKIAPNFGFEAY